MKKYGVFLFSVMMLFSVCFVVAQETDDSLFRARVATTTAVDSDLTRLRFNYQSDIDVLRYRYAQNSAEFETAYEQLVERIQNSDLTDEEKEALLERLRERRENALERIDDYRAEVRALHERYRNRAEDYEDASKAFLERVRASNLTAEEKAELRAEVEAFKEVRAGIRAEFRAEIDALKAERRGAVNESRELLRMLREENLTEEERAAIREEIALTRSELRDARQAFVDEARNLRVEYRGALHDFITNVRENYTLRDGRNVTVKIMPDVASERAIERLRLKSCSEEHNCTIDFKEVGEGNNARLRYEVKAKKEGRFLGVIKMRMDVESEVDAETGEVVRVRKPWFAFLVNE